MFKHLHQTLSKGIPIGKNLCCLNTVEPGRSSIEARATILLKNGDISIDIMDVFFFSGIKPWYHPWIELVYPYEFISEEGELSLSYYDSIVERRLIRLFCDSLSSAGKIFVSYESDDETRKGLMISIPPVITRIGFLLYSCGCTWYKDWYFAEGGLEGTQKLQGEKPFNESHKNRQLDVLQRQVSEFIMRKTKSDFVSYYEKNAIKRGKKLLADLCQSSVSTTQASQ